MIAGPWPYSAHAEGFPADVGLVDDVVDDERGVVDEFDADGVVGGVGRLAAQRFTDEDGHRRANALAAGERDVPDLVGEFAGLDGVEHLDQAVFDLVTTPFQVLHVAWLWERPASS